MVICYFPDSWCSQYLHKFKSLISHSIHSFLYIDNFYYFSPLNWMSYKTRTCLCLQLLMSLYLWCIFYKHAIIWIFYIHSDNLLNTWLLRSDIFLFFLYFKKVSIHIFGFIIIVQYLFFLLLPCLLYTLFYSFI